MTPAKTCSCGAVYASIPAYAERFEDEHLGGYYWECACRTTCYVPFAEAPAEAGVARTGVLMAAVACAALALAAFYLSRAQTIFMGFGGETQAKESAR